MFDVFNGHPNQTLTDHVFLEPETRSALFVLTQGPVVLPKADL